MCIVIAKEKGVKFPPIENIANSCDNNPDGFSVAWAIDGVLRNYRTMSRKDFLKKCKEIFKLDYKRTACIIHARIATHGTVVLENTHCWIDETTAMAFAHNGILSVSNRGNMTDSETFFRDVFLPIYSAYGWDKAEMAINACIGSSKFAFLKANGELRVFGNYNTLQGVLYSNTSYLERTTYYGGCGKTYSWPESVWDPANRVFVYRGTMSDAEWAKTKESIRANCYWDWEHGKWIFRENESQAEWNAKKLKSEADYEEYKKHWGYDAEDWD